MKWNNRSKNIGYIEFNHLKEHNVIVIYIKNDKMSIRCVIKTIGSGVLFFNNMENFTIGEDVMNRYLYKSCDYEVYSCPEAFTESKSYRGCIDFEFLGVKKKFFNIIDEVRSRRALESKTS